MSTSLIEQLQQRTALIAVLGLGYTGWPLANALSEHFEVIGYDPNEQRVSDLLNGVDRTGESINASKGTASMHLDSTPSMLHKACCYIIAVPTPVNEQSEPDLQYLQSALRTVGAVLKRGDLVIVESTVYPGCTEEFCIPILEEHSGLKGTIDFGMGYSPERINPGDRIHTLASVTKLVAASDAKWLDVVKFIYDVIVPAGVFVCSSIKVAEAAKITENIQRDVNIALMNQLAELYQRLHIPTGEVWQAAATKWNFLPFRPGLAGGHCISVDPYYLLHKASQVSFSPTLVAEARRINEMVKARIVKRLLAHLEQAGVDKKSARILIMGVTFKANVADVRNAKIAEVALELMKLGCHIDLSDPLADAAALQQEYGLTLVQTEKVDYDIIVIAADHAAYYTLDEDYFCQRTRTGALVADLNGIYRNKINQRNYWTL
jgi:UDP-N-acetyl-D-galactosamine dehydrogenase